MIAFLRANPVIGIMLAGLAIVTLVFGVLAILMTRAGVSLRPLVFMAVFLGIVAGPQMAYHLGQAYGLIPRRDLTWTFGKDRPTAGYVEQDRVLAAPGGRFADPNAVFGPGIDRDLVVDLRGTGGDSPFATAEVAQMAVIPPSSSAIVARYGDASSASSASARYMSMAFGATPAPGRDGAHTFSRPQGDVAKVLVAGRTLVVLTGPDDAALAARLRSSRIVAPAARAAFVPAGPVSEDARDFWLYRPAVLVGGVLILMILASVWFFRGAAWAGTIPARDGAAPRPAHELRQRLLSVNSVDAPFTVAEQGDGRIAVTWRFADAKWVDLARAHGIRNTHRILLELDETSKTVYPAEQYSRLDWSAGADGGSVRWSSAKGIVFFQLEHQRVFGLQIDEGGRFVPKLSYSYTFSLQEMKAPFIEAVTESGWQWRPTLWQGPRWTRWLTH